MSKILFCLFCVSCGPLFLLYGNDNVSTEGLDLWTEAAEREKMLPPEKLNTGYFLTKQGNLIPAYVSIDNGIAYLWKGVVLTQAQVPRLNISGSYAITPFNMPEFQIKFELNEIEPKIYYLSLNNGKYAEGYYDRLHLIFFRWNNVEYKKDDMPKNTETEGLIVNGDESTMDFLTISPPTENSHDLESLRKEYDEALEAKRLKKNPKLQVSESLILEKKFVASRPPELTTKVSISKEQSSPWPVIVAGVILAVLAGGGLFWMVKKISST